MGIVGSSVSKIGVSGAAAARPAKSAVFASLALLLCAVLIAVAGCSRSDKPAKSTGLSKRVIQPGQPVPKGGGRYKVGNPYQIKGRWYHPHENTSYDKVGVASWYGDLFHGRYTANGEVFDMNALTAAHPTLPMPTYAEVTNLENRRTIVVRINDRGPYARNRVIDLSKRSAKELGVYRPGTAKVRVRYLGKAPLNGDDSYERQVLARQPWIRYAQNRKSGTRPMALAQTSDSVTVSSTPKAQPKAIAKPAKATAAVPRPPARPATTRRGRAPLLFVQAGSFRNERNANAVRDQLAGVGQVHVFPAEVAGTMWYRVRLGPFRENDRASAALDKVVAAGSTGAHIVRN